MNELLASLITTLQVLLFTISVQGAMSPDQVAIVMQSVENAQEVLHTSARIKTVQKTIKNENAFKEVNKDAVVNILCTTRSGGEFNPISGSGVIIDKRGVILTNAHVAQYVLLQDLDRVNLKCVARTGAPAKTRYAVKVLFMPSKWVLKHAKDIKKEDPKGTGEGDYALLVITKKVGAISFGNTLFPVISLDTGIDYIKSGNQTLLISYPAGFLGGVTIQRNLWPVSTLAHIQRLMTFGSGFIDVFSLGGSIVAQSGSSGGAVINKFGNLIGLITTSSHAPTTDKRDLRAISLAYINKDLKKQTGFDIRSFLGRDVNSILKQFYNSDAVKYIEQYKKVLHY